MFKVGEKVICINAGYLDSIKGAYGWRRTKNPTSKLKNGNIYTIINPNGGSDDVSLEEVEYSFFDNRRFISLTEYRKQKLEKLNNKYV